MKLWQWLKRSFRNIGINTPGFEQYFAFGGGISTASGVYVSEHSALTISTVHQCVRVIADTIASLPCILYVRRRGGKDRAENHPLYRVLHEEPNPFMTPYEFKQALQGHLCLWGNAFAEIERNGAGQVQNLWPLRPDRMRLQVFNNRIYYYYILEEGTERQLTDVFHLRGIGSDGLVGYSPIALAREALGMSKASEEYRARFFKNDARPGGLLLHPQRLSEEAKKNLRESWNDRHEGLSNRSRVGILEEGLKWQDVGIPPDDAQYIEGQEFQKSDIAALYRVPSYKIGLLKPGTVSYASVEQQAIDFVVDCIRPWLVCWEERATLALLRPTERRQYYAEFLVDALLRGDADSRARFYTALFNIGAISANEIREKENWNRIDNGDRYYVPLNTIPVDLVDDVVAAKIEPKPAESAPSMPMQQPKMLNGYTNGAAK